MSFLNKKLYFYLLLTPTIILFIMYLVVPIIMGLRFSFTDFSGLGDYSYIGFANFKLLLRDKTYILALKNTMIIMVQTLFILIPFSFLLALIVNRKVRGTSILKTIYFIPVVIAGVIIGLLWVFILDPYNGLINIVLNKLNLDFMALQWIGGKTLTPYSTSIVFVWNTAGFYMVIFLAGIKQISPDLYEASVIDGASNFQQVIHITIPMLRESFKICGILIILSTIKVFETIYMLTGGGPNHFSESIMSLMYNIIFYSRNYGAGMAIAVTNTLIGLVFGLVWLWFTRRNVER